MGAPGRELCGPDEVQNSHGASDAAAEDNEERQQVEREGTPLHLAGYDGDGLETRRHEGRGYGGFPLPSLRDPPDRSRKKALQT